MRCRAHGARRSLVAIEFAVEQHPKTLETADTSLLDAGEDEGHGPSLGLSAYIETPILAPAEGHVSVFDLDEAQVAAEQCLVDTAEERWLVLLHGVGSADEDSVVLVPVRKSGQSRQLSRNLARELGLGLMHCVLVGHGYLPLELRTSERGGLSGDVRHRSTKLRIIISLKHLKSS